MSASRKLGNYIVKNKGPITLTVCCSAHGIQDGLGAALYALIPILAQTFGLSYLQVGFIKGVSSFVMTVFELPSSFLAERFGERRLLAFGLLAAGAGYLSMPAAVGFMSLVCALALFGLGAAFQHALSSAAISHAYEQDSGRRVALGTYNAAGDGGKLLFAGIFSLAISLGLAWETVVLAFGGIAIGGGLVLAVALKRVGVGDPSIAATTTEPSAQRHGWGIRHPAAFGTLSAIVFLDIAVQGSFLTFIAFLMIEKNVPTSLAAFAVVLTLAGGIFGKFGCGLLVARFGVFASLAVVQSLTALGIMAVLAAPTLVAYCFLPILGVVLQGSSTITYGSVNDVFHGERRSRGFAAIYSISSSASIVGPVAFGLVADRISLTTALVAMACIVLLTIPLSAYLRNALAAVPAPVQ